MSEQLIDTVVAALMGVLFVIVLALAIMGLFAAFSLCQAAPLEITVHEQARQFRNTCTITLREPVTDRELGRYECVSGGFGRGSAPFAHYQIGEFIDDGHGKRWSIHESGREDGEVWDPRIGDMRTEIQLHAMRGNGYTDGTLGCLGVYGGPGVWARFVGQMQYLIAWYGVIEFDYGQQDLLMASTWMDRA